MRVVIAGSRNLKIGPVALSSLVHTAPFYNEMTQILSGGASGIDSYAAMYADHYGIPFTEYRPEYRKYTAKAAPIIRNKAMADNADALIAVWDGKSRGTRNMIDEAKARNLKIHLIIIQIGAEP